MTASTPRRPGRPTRRVLLSSSAAALPLAAGLAGCGTAQSSPPAAAVPPAKVSWFVYSFNARQNEIFDATVRQAFEKEHPGYQLEVTAGGGVDKLITLATSGQAPDMEWYGSPVLWTQGLLRKLNDLLARDKIDTKVFAPATFKSWNMVRDAVIALPVQTGGNWPVVPYNRDLFTRAGVSEPLAKWGDPKWTWDAFADACKRLTTSMSQGGTAGKWAVNLPVAGDWFIESHAYLWKASWLSDDWKTATPDSPAMIESFRAFADLAVKQHVVPRPGELQGDAASNFLNGNLAMLSASGGTMSQVVDAVKKGSPFGFAPLPAMKVAASAIQFDGNAILKDAKHPDQAWVVMKWAASTVAWPVARGTPPARADLFDAWAKELYGDVAQSIRLPVYRDALANGEGIDPLNLQPRLADIKSVALVPAIKDIFTGERNVEDALRAAKAPMQALLQPVG